MRCTAFFFAAAVLALTAVPACTHRLRTERIVWTPDAAAAPRRALNSGACAGWESYVPDPNHPDHQPLRYLRVNFHVMDNAAGTAHRPPDTVRVFLRRLLELANAELDTNVRNWQSPDGTPTLPKRYRYVLTPQAADPADDGIYFHYDDSLFFYVSSGRYQNNYDRRVVQKYGTGLDSILNIFLQVHPRDSFDSKTYHANGQGIALGNALKMAGVLESREGPDSFDGLLNHEIGHILGLNHAWVEDGCPDTKNHPNKCWEWSKAPPCSQLATNNMMDYNAYQIALTPCQIGKARAAGRGEQSGAALPGAQLVHVPSGPRDHDCRFGGLDRRPRPGGQPDRCAGGRAVPVVQAVDAAGRADNRPAGRAVVARRLPAAQRLRPILARYFQTTTRWYTRRAAYFAPACSGKHRKSMMWSRAGIPLT